MFIPLLLALLSHLTSWKLLFAHNLATQRSTGEGDGRPCPAAGWRLRSCHAHHTHLLGAELFHSVQHELRVQRPIAYVLDYAAHEAADYPQECRDRYHGLPFLRTINASWQQPVCSPQVRTAFVARVMPAYGGWQCAQGGVPCCRLRAR